MSTVICPKCGKSLTVNSDDGDMIFCEYCGTKVNINVNFNFNYNYSKSEHTERIIDDAKIKAAENVNRVIGVFASPFEERRKAKEEQKRKEEEEACKREEAQREAQERARIRNARVAAFCKAHPKELLITIMASCIALIAGVSLWNVSNAHQAELAAHQAELARLEEEKIANSHLALGEAKIPEFSKTGDYRNAVKALKDAGFTNVTAIAKGDMILGLLETENYIDEVTVDGAPDFETNKWYPVNVPIEITYHSFYTAASSSIEKVSASKIEDFCYAEAAEDATVYIWGTPSENIVRIIYAYPNNVSICFIGRITSGSLTDGCTIHYNYISDDGNEDGFEYKLVVSNGQMSIDYGDGTGGTTSNVVSLNTIEKLRQGIWIEFPEGCNPTEFLNQYTSDSSSSVAENIPSEASNPTGLTDDDYDEYARVDMAYVSKGREYDTYCYISAQKRKVWTFSNGNGSQEAYVGHITDGTYTTGYTVHYNYDLGWDETISPTDGGIVVTDAYGYTTRFTKTDAKFVKKLYDSEYMDIPEN